MATKVRPTGRLTASISSITLEKAAVFELK
jgi:hypothetical protein